MNNLRQTEAAEIVAALYRDLLGREADAAGLTEYSGRIAEGQPAATIPPVLHELYGSAEAELVRARNALSTMTQSVIQQRGGGTRPIVGLGSHCYTAALLKSAGLKTGSYPFDWIFASPAMVAHMLDNDFATFLDRSQYEFVPPERRRDGPDVNLCDHVFYRENFQVPFVFNHRNPLDDDDYEYLQRCVARFRDVARNGSPTFLMTTKAWPDWDRGFATISRSVRAYAPTANLVHVIVGDTAARAVPSTRVVADRNGHAVIELTPGSPWRALWFDNVLDDITLLALALDRI